MTGDDNVTARLARVERTNRLLLGGIVLLGLAVVGGGVSRGASESEAVVSARAFHLVDARGTVVMELSLGEDGPGLFIRDADGHDRIRLVHDAEQSGLFVQDERGDTRIGIAQFAHGGAGSRCTDPRPKVRPSCT